MRRVTSVFLKNLIAGLFGQCSRYFQFLLHSVFLSGIIFFEFKIDVLASQTSVSSLNLVRDYEFHIFF